MGQPRTRDLCKVAIIGAGGHGQATACYSGRNFGIADVAVIDKGWLGGGNTGRNTTIIRSNCLQDSSAAIHDARRVKELVPIINIDWPRYPVLGGLYQARGGTARHDAVAWGYARACSATGMHIIQNCEVTGIETEGGQVRAADTSRGRIDCDKLALVVAGHSSQLAAKAGFRLPIKSVALQAMASEPVKPCMDVVVMAHTVHGYMSPSDKGEMVIGGGTDSCNIFTQRGFWRHIEETVRALIETFPMISRLKCCGIGAGSWT